MNSSAAKNFICLGEGQRVKEEFFKSAISSAGNGQYVLYIASKPLDKLPEVEKPDTDILKHIIFMYFSKIDDLINKLLQLHTWSIIPEMIIVESLHTFSCDKPEEEATEKFCLLIAILFNCINSISKTLNKSCSTLVSISENSSLPSDLVQKLIDLFYYKQEQLKVVPTPTIN